MVGPKDRLEGHDRNIRALRKKGERDAKSSLMCNFVNAVWLSLIHFLSILPSIVAHSFSELLFFDSGETYKGSRL